MTAVLENECYELRYIIEVEMKCNVGVRGTPMTHSVSGCSRCRALAALDRIEQELKRRETA